jgi:hypothetical protein
MVTRCLAAVGTRNAREPRRALCHIEMLAGHNLLGPWTTVLGLLGPRRPHTSPISQLQKDSQGVSQTPPSSNFKIETAQPSERLPLPRRTKNPRSQTHHNPVPDRGNLPIPPNPHGMALPAPPKQLRVRLPENERVARCLHEKRLSVQEQTGGLKVNLDRTFAKAYGNVCASEEPIRTLKEFSKIKYPCFPFLLSFFYQILCYLRRNRSLFSELQQSCYLMTYYIRVFFYHDAQIDFEIHGLFVIYTVFLLHNKASLTHAS